MIWVALMVAAGHAQENELVAPAPSFNARGVLPAAPNTGLRDPIFGWRAKPQNPGIWGLHLLAEYADEPLVLYRSDGDGPRVDPVLDNLFDLHLMGGVALHERVGVYAGLPIVLSHQVNGTTRGVALGDARISVPIGIVLPTNGEGAALSLLPYADLPTGSERSYLGYDQGEGLFSGGAALAGGYAGGRWGLDAHLGVGTSPKIALANIIGGVRGTGGLSTHVLFGEYHAVRAEVNAATGRGGSSKMWSQTPAEAALSVRGTYAAGWSWTLGGAHGLSRGAGAAAFRVFAGVGFGPGAKVAAPVMVEAPDAPPMPEPIPPGVLVVSVVDEAGAPVNATLIFDGPHPIEAATTGPDGLQETPVSGGSWRVLAEAQGFGTGRHEVVIDQGQRQEVTIVLAKPKVTMTDGAMQLEKVLFHFDETRLIDASKPILEECANVLLAHPEVTLLEIAGHTDMRGQPTYNLELSQGRVNTVRNYLIQRGVDPTRLTAQGYGESKPLSTADSEAAHQTNRRVEFIILKRDIPSAETSP